MPGQQREVTRHGSCSEGACRLVGHLSGLINTSVKLATQVSLCRRPQSTSYRIQSCSCQHRRQERWAAQQDVSNPALPQDSKTHHRTSQQSGIRAPTFLVGECFSVKTRHPSNLTLFCYSGSDSKEYTEEGSKALVVCDEARGPRGSVYTHLKQNKTKEKLLVIL